MVCLVITVDLKVLLQTEKTIEKDYFLKKTKIRKNKKKSTDINPSEVAIQRCPIKSKFIQSPINRINLP